MKANSLAFRLFVTAAAWVLVVLPIAGWIIFPRYRYEAVHRLRRAHLAAAHRRHQRRRRARRGPAPAAPNNWGEGLFVDHAFGLVLADQAARRQAGRDPALALARRRRPAAARARTSVEPNDKEVRWANLMGPAAAAGARCRADLRVRRAARRRSATRSAVAGKLSEVEDNLAAFRAQLIQALALAGVGLLAVTLFQIRFGLFPLSQGGAEPGRHPLRRGDPARRRAALRDQAAAAGAQRAAQVQPGDRRARAHARRQPGARAQDAARRAHQRGARRRLPARPQGHRAGRHHDHPGQPLPRSRAHGRAHRRHRPRHRGAAGRRIHRAGAGAHLPRQAT